MSYCPPRRQTTTVSGVTKVSSARRRRRGWVMRVGSSAVCALIAASQTATAQSAPYSATNALSSDFSRTLAPSQILLSSTPRTETKPLSVGKNIQADDFSFSGLVSARDSGFAMPDYRANPGFGYQTQLG